jgi:hypothetical protein
MDNMKVNLSEKRNFSFEVLFIAQGTIFSSRFIWNAISFYFLHGYFTRIKMWCQWQLFLKFGRINN